MRKTYWQILIDLWADKEWVSNLDYQRATKGSPKFTSRISDMRKRGILILDRWVDNAEEGRHKEYKLATSPSLVRIRMTRRAA